MQPETTVRARLLRVRLRIFDALRNSRAAHELCAVAGLASSFVMTAPDKKLLLRAVAYRRARSGILRKYSKRWLSTWLNASRAGIWRQKKIGWSRFRSDIRRKMLDRSIILKSPSPDGEKGVLYISFENNWLRLIAHHDTPRLLQEYFLVLASSSSPPDFASHWAFARIGPDPVFVQISNPSDLPLHERVTDCIRPIPIMASDWINPDFYQPRPQPEREIDVLMVAGWSSLKRHWLLFRALRKMRCDLRVVLIGQDSEGRTADDVWGEAKAFGVSDRIEMIRDANIGTVTDYQCNSKISVVLSAQEGSSVVAAESFFANCPVAMVHNAHIGSRAYINPKTGVLLRASTMSAQLSEMIEQYTAFSPRAWAVESITCFHSTKKLNSLLAAYSRESGLSYRRDIVPFCWRPDPSYVSASDATRLAPAYQELHHRHGVAIAGRTVTEDAVTSTPR